MADSSVPWTALEPTGPQPPPAIATAFQQGQDHGFEIGQKLAVRHALSSYDMDNPASAYSALGGLIHAGALDQANALMGLNVTRTFNDAVLPMVQARMRALQGGGSGPSALQPEAPPTPDGAPAPPPAPSQAQAHADLLNQAAADVEGLSRLPPDQVPAAAAALKAKYEAQGIPAEAIDQHLTDLSPTGLANTAQYLRSVASTPEGGSYPPHPAGASAYGWVNDTLTDPMLNDPYFQMVAKRAGYDPTASIDRAERLAMPGITAAAQTASAGPIESARQGAITAALPEQEGIRAAGAGLTEELRQQATARHAAEIAAGHAAGEAGGSAPSKIQEVKLPDGSTQQGTFTPGPNGTYTFHPIQADGTGSGAGRSPGIGAQHTMATQATQAAEVLKPDPGGRNQAVDTEANSLRALSIIGAHKFDNTTPIKAQVAALLRSAGIHDADRYATDMAGYQSLATAALTGGAHQAFPTRTTDRDLKLMQTVFPSLTTPNDQASTAFGMQAAQAHRTQQWEDFKSQYAGDKTDPNAVYRAWLSGPGGQSIFQSPIWGRVTIGGRPAFNPATDIRTVNGKQVGAWGIGTGHPVFFPVR